MIDYHTHILPEIDDGSQSVGESLQMLRVCRDEGCEAVVLTPHFYPEEESVEAFLGRRQVAFDRLQQGIIKSGETFPELVIGAEVLYYDGISGLEQVERLEIGDRKELLIELPYGVWGDRIADELYRLRIATGMKIILAHIDRYFGIKANKGKEEALLAAGCSLQLNAGFVATFRDRRRGLRLWKEGKVKYLGSDCHNMSSRPPGLSRAAALLK